MLSPEFITKIEDLARRSVAMEVEVNNPEPEVIGPIAVQGGKVQSLEHLLINPRRKKGAVKTIIPDHFISYVEGHKEHGTIIVGSIKSGTFRAVLDHHEPGEGGKPKWGEHEAVLNLVPDPDWDRWLELSEYSGQDDFATALDELAHTIEEPDSATIIDIVRRFQATQVKSFERPVYDEQSGSVKLNYSDETEQRGTMKLPAKIFASVSIFRAMPPETIEAETKFRFYGGGIKFAARIVRPDRLVEAAFQRVADLIADKTGIRPIIDA